MQKRPQIINILDTTSADAVAYEAAVGSSGFIPKLSMTELEFFKTCLHVIPDIIVINGSCKDIKAETIVKKLNKHPIMKSVPIILLLEKLGFNAEETSKKLKVDLGIFPLKNNDFLQSVKKNSKKVTLAPVILQSANEVKSEIVVELEDISEMHISFLAAVRVPENCPVVLKAAMLGTLGIVNENFKTKVEGQMQESKHYKNELGFRGLLVEVLRDLKKYLVRNKSKV